MNTWDWTPISFSDLEDKIILFELEQNGELKNFWDLIKISPAKWQEPEMGKEGGGFWVVALCGQRIIWYNDIEEGFNISEYKVYGQFEQYGVNQNKLEGMVEALYNFIAKPW